MALPFHRVKVYNGKQRPGWQQEQPAAAEGREHAGNDVSFLTPRTKLRPTDTPRATPPNPSQTVPPIGHRLFKHDSPEAILIHTHTLCLADVTKKLHSHMTLQKSWSLPRAHTELAHGSSTTLLPACLQREPGLGQREQRLLLCHLHTCSADLGTASVQTLVRSLVLVVSGNTHPTRVPPDSCNPHIVGTFPSKH